VAWIYIRALGVDGALARLTSEIRDLANGRGQAALYHDTITRAWTYIVAHATNCLGPESSFGDLLEAHPELLDKHLLLRHYRRETLASPEARAGWVAPDVRSLPGAPPSAEGASVLREAPLSAEAYRAVMAGVPAPVAVVGGRDATDVHATTVSSLVSIALDPPTVSFSVGDDSQILAMIRAARCFSVSFLADHQSSLAEHFAAADRPPGHAQFAGVPHRAGRGGLPILTEAAAWLECDLRDEHRLGARVIVDGVVTAAGSGTSHPLLRVWGGYV
jgi:flavin reductase (DIM6/NTAB) family NADH-FMN oxidoreductase RutF